MSLLIPIQFLGPALKGMYEYGWRPIMFSVEKRSGSNFSGLEKMSGSLCNTGSTHIAVVPLGTVYPPKEIHNEV